MDAYSSMDQASSPSPFDRATKSPLPVLIGGLVTGVLALALVWLLAGAADFNLMTWYLWFIVPAGAIVVGMVAGSGYGMASWVTGTKISKGLLIAVLALQVGCYFGAMVLEYRQAVVAFELEGVSFFAYFDFTTRMFAFIGDDGLAGDPMGGWGYVFRILEITGFAVGGLIVPLAMRAKPFCDTCHVYMKSKPLTLLPAGVQPRKVKKKDTEGQEAFAAEAGEAFTSGIQTLTELCGHAEAGRADAFRELVESYSGDQKSIDKLTARLRLVARVCPRCRRGSLDAEMVTGQGENVKAEAVSSTPLEPAMALSLLEPGRRVA